MRRGTIVATIIATSLVVLGGVIFGGAMSIVKWNFMKLSMSTCETNEYTVSEAYQNIKVVTCTANVILVPSDTNETEVVCREQTQRKHTVTVQEDTLVIEVVDTLKWYQQIFNFGTTTITVYVPSSVLGDVSVKNSTGNVKMSDCTLGNLTVKNATGNVSLENVQVTDRIAITNSTGNVKFKDCDAASIYVKTSTGNVKGNFLTEKQFITNTSTGNIRVPESEVGGRCEITTSTGNIHFTIG
ncbi:MAG: DUF4097 family beta strand repeat protein [Clostridia bacterium]|nr:DUF4097 family beta strand repeat protein [Clostridia bacterium]